MSKHDAGILHAPTAFGKTVTAIGMITKRKVNTLIWVHSRQLLDQWRERLKSFLPDVNVDIATYQSLINIKDNIVSEPASHPTTEVVSDGLKRAVLGQK